MPGGGGGDKTTTVQKADPWEPQQQYLLDMFSRAQNLYGNYAPQYYPESGVAAASPYLQTATAQYANFGNSPYFQDIVSQGRGAMNTLGQAQSPWTNPVLGLGVGQVGNLDNYMRSTLQGQNAVNPKDAQGGQVLPNYQQMVGQMTGNPQLDAMVNAAQTRTAQNFNEQVMPQISMSALGNNAFGGSRQGVAEALAADRLQQQMGDIATGMYGAAYESGQNRALQGAQTQAGLTQGVNLANAQQWLQAQQLNQQGQQYAAGMGQNLLQGGYGQSLDAARLQGALTGQMAQLGLMPAQTMAQAGSMDQSYQQSVLDDNIARWNWNQQLPWQQLQQYAGLVGNGGYGQNSTGSTSGGGTSTSPLTGALGGGLASLGALGPLGLTFAANPVAAPLVVGGGALLGALGNM